MGDKNPHTFSPQFVDGMERVLKCAMLHVVGFSNEDFKKP